jgi:hypothetical protein
VKFRQTTVLFISLRYTKIVFLRNTRRDEIERPQTISSRTLRTNEGLYIYIYIYLSIYLSVSIYLSIYLSIYIFFFRYALGSSAPRRVLSVKDASPSGISYRRPHRTIPGTRPHTAGPPAASTDPPTKPST